MLIDEIGAHLRPRWRMRIVGGLRRMLPRMQFIVSTPEPRIEKYETVLMRRDERSIAVSPTGGAARSEMATWVGCAACRTYPILVCC